MVQETMTSTEALKRFGATLAAKLAQYKSDRRLKDLQMLEDLRQYRAEYDPTIKQKLQSANRSMVYPRNTRKAVVGTRAKMMEMMFPATERNWSVVPEEFPSLSQVDMATVIADAEQKKAEEAQKAQTQLEPLTPEEVAAAVREFAERRADNMEREIKDQLDEMPIEYPQLCKMVLHSGTLYGWGVLEGPLTRAKEEKVYAKQENGQWGPVTKRIPRPDFEHVRSWDIYPDMSAKHWNNQEGLFRRFIFSRHDLTKLIERDDIMKEELKEYLRTHTDGNYKAETYEAELRVLDQTMNVQKVEKRRYEVYRYFGFVAATEMAAIGVDVLEKDLYKSMLVDIWVIPGGGEGTIIKAEKAIFGEHVGDQYHPFFYDDEEEAGLLGISLPSILRDSQLKLAATDRMLMDNGAACLGPIVVADKSRLARENKNVEIGAFTTIYTDTSEDPANNTKVVESFQVESHIRELLELRREYKQIFDDEANLNPLTMGDPNGVGEAFRTSGNLSQLTGGAHMMTKDQVRAFDRFTDSVIGSIVRWNIRFTDKPEIKGDFKAVARGTISLVAKEVRGAALAQWRTTLTPREQVVLKTWNLMSSELKSRDLTVDDILLDPLAAQKALDAFDAAQSQAASVEQGLTQAKTQRESAAAGESQAKAQAILGKLQGEINDLVSRANLALSKAKGVKDAHQLDVVRTILEQIDSAAGAGRAASGKGKGA